MHLRTDASTRFEKDLDATQASVALQRFIFLASHLKLLNTTNSLAITVLGTEIPPRTLRVEHKKLEKILGTSLENTDVLERLHALGFTAHFADHSYTMTVPAWRHKDILYTEDIAEEIGRGLGWDTIVPTLAFSPITFS